MMLESTSYRYGGARALVLLHEKHMRRFLETWRAAKAAAVELPRTEDPAYASLEMLLGHILSAARGYMVWMCKVLDLPDPGIRLTPKPDVIEAEAERYLEHVLDRWRSPLADLTEDRAHEPTHTSGWNVEYCIDAMLEHAVMHPIRHRFQLEELMAERQPEPGA